LIGTQFQGAFTDNALKWLVSLLVLEAGVSREQRDFFACAGTDAAGILAVRAGLDAFAAKG